ncbi:hypothetical protein BDW02DRAFT_496370 [Decorospora gaudefroyi]|uniref:Uncharacterized protein n=1 Tax=Decorospora gaudefroyi TaxID=184978 RepID=A0A6A5KNT5_9PLEO|nr:hypothetical protein BDW02DRAFT_496370 [Decorospora gaudefroyi]
MRRADVQTLNSVSADQSPPPQPKTKAPHRRLKRDGPLQLQFVTATDPSQFKDAVTKRNVRSHAMIHYRNKQDVINKKNKKKPDAKTEKVSSAKKKSPIIADRIEPILIHDPLSDPEPKQHIAANDELLSKEHVEDQLCSHSDSRAYEPTASQAPVLRRRASYIRTRKVIFKLKGHVVEYEYTENQVERQLRIFAAKIATFCQIGDGVDPFVVLPQFQHPELDILFLTRSCMRAFSTESCLVKWLPAMLSHPDILLSAPVMASTWLDMHSQCLEDSKRTALLKVEIISMINRRLRDPETQCNDLTLFVILHLLGGEMRIGNEETLRTHISGIARFLAQRGGLYQFAQKALAETCAAVCTHCNIFCEMKPLSIFTTWEPEEYIVLDDNTAIPESPLFCPRPDFVTIAKDPRCSPSTCDLLRDMRDLTDLFIAHNADIYDVSDVPLSSIDTDYITKFTAIRSRLTLLPSAYTPGLATSNDWVYEACRLAALIFTASMVQRLPFSTTADPSRNVLVPESISMNHDAPFPTTRLSETLYEVLQRTDLDNVWNDMSGVLYWVTAVGAAAARAIDVAPGPELRYAVWVRRCLTMFSMRVMTVLMFEHPVPVLRAQKKLLRVQELVGTYGGG